MKLIKKKYKDIILLDIYTEEVAEWDTSGSTNQRIFLPATSANEIEMQNRGFYLSDRTLGASIRLNGASRNFSEMIKMSIIESTDYIEDIRKIARCSFSQDRRFCILPICTQEIADLVLEEWIATIDRALICLYKEKAIGFLVLQEIDSSTLFIRLAAVEEKHRLSGAAISLYARAAEYAKEKGYKKLNGRISSRNMSAMNLYAYLGASFYEPIDIFLK